jgi:hypothetical protein
MAFRDTTIVDGRRKGNLSYTADGEKDVYCVFH